VGRSNFRRVGCLLRRTTRRCRRWCTRRRQNTRSWRSGARPDIDIARASGPVLRTRAREGSVGVDARGSIHAERFLAFVQILRTVVPHPTDHTMTPVSATEVCARGAIHARGRLETFVDVISAVVSLPTGLTDTGVTSLGILTALVVIAEVQSSGKKDTI